MATTYDLFVKYRRHKRTNVPSAIGVLCAAHGFIGAGDVDHVDTRDLVRQVPQRLGQLAACDQTTSDFFEPASKPYALRSIDWAPHPGHA